MNCYEVCEIGRESVKSVNASTLATIIKELVNKYEKNKHSKSQHRKYYIKCKDKLEFIPKHKKIGEDEGFESDANEEDSLSGDLSNEDSQSTTSSCCLVEDHVLKTSRTESFCERDPTSLISIIGSIDSANSSGSSDTDELDLHSLTPSPNSPFKKQSKSYLLDINKNKKLGKNKKEEFPISDVIFCHTESKHPTVIAWVIKKQQTDTDYGSRLGTTGVENYTKSENCLEVIVTKCKNNDDLRELCSNYQDYRKRIKLDQYKTIKRKRDEKHLSLTLTSPICSKDVKVSLSDMKVANSSLIKASELSILNPKIMASFKSDLKNSISLNSLNKPEQGAVHNNEIHKINQDLIAANQYQHLSVKKTQSLMNLSKSWDIKCDTFSRNGKSYKNESPVLKDRFNLIQRTDLNGVTHLEISKAGDNKIINDKLPPTKSKLRKEIEGVILTDVESYAKKDQIRQRQNPENSHDTPPIRPERKKFLKKKILDGVQDQNSQPVTKSTNSFFLTPQPNENSIKDQKILKGTYVRIQSWGSQKRTEPTINTWRTDLKDRGLTKPEEKHIERRRSKSAGRIPKKTPMAYRYVDTVNDYGRNHSVPPNLTMNNARRRKSFDDIIAMDNLNGNLKSVIKKNKKANDKYCEPKKVTFSAFATVQVVD